jgi:glycerate kinase
MMIAVPAQQPIALIAPDKFKGTLRAAEVADAIAAGCRAAEAPVEPDPCPLADGGDGTAEVLLEALGGRWVLAGAHDALGEPIETRFAMLADGSTAVVEVAAASGLARLDPERLDPLAADSAGTGELISAAIEAGASRVLVGCGGSATTDGGLGALLRFDPTAAEIVCLCDVDDVFAGALRYAPQKGAGPEELEELAERLERIAAGLPHDPRRLPFTGAAGGLAGGLWAHGARLVGGARHVLDAVGFDRRLAAADLVISGEGAVDAGSLRGKVVGEVARRAAAAGRPCHLIVGRDDLGPDRSRERFASVSEATTPEAIAAAASALPAALIPPPAGPKPD